MPLKETLIAIVVSWWLGFLALLLTGEYAAMVSTLGICGVISILLLKTAWGRNILEVMQNAP